MDSSRRGFAGAVAAPLFVPRSVWGANDRIAYAVLATGGRGRYVSTVFTEMGGDCMALCDVYEPNLELALKDSPKAKLYRNYHELLAKEKNIDAVLIASPDHHHAPMLYAALAAKKDVYLEKPLSKTLDQSGQMIAAVRKSKQVVQIGMQRRSAPAIIAARKIVEEGTLGRITIVKAQWHWAFSKPLDNSPLPGKIDWEAFLGDAPKRPLEPRRYRWWRGFWDYAGGNMTDQGTHLMDVVQSFMQSGPPQTAFARGYLAKMEGAEHPDVFTATFEYPNFITTWTLDYCNSFQNGWSISFFGDRGTMVLDGFGYRVYAEPFKHNAPPVLEEKAPVPVTTHVGNFYESLRARKEPNCTVEMAAQAVAGPHLANISLREGRMVKLGADGRAV
jgi:predicted dehydrogenase